MPALPPDTHPLLVASDSRWLPPICFGAKPYLKLCRNFDRALKKLEARYPSVIPPLTLQVRNEQLKRRPK
jgi:hypothetical protein